MLAIPLSDGSFTVVDDDKFDELSQHSWRNQQGYAYATIGGKQIAMARFITKATRGEVVDHVNGNTLLNISENLRRCSHSQNNCNKGVGTNNRSGEKGVSWHKASNKWRVSINVDCKYIYIGTYSDLNEAVAARKLAEEKYHKEFAKSEKEDYDFSEIYMSKWNQKSLELFSIKQSPKSVGNLSLLDDCVYITLTDGQMSKISIEDYALVSQYKWYAHYYDSTDSCYAHTNVRGDDGLRHQKSMHSLILGTKENYHIDHIDGVTTNNHRNNLRFASRFENMRNRGLFKTNTSGCAGVSFHKGKQKWQAQYAINGKNKCIGTFDTKEEAIAARLAVVTDIYGDFLRA